MPKNLLNDMVKRSPKVDSRRAARSEQRPEPSNFVKIPDDLRGTGGRRRRRWGLWFIAAVSVIFFLFALSYLFAKATVTVNPKIEDVSLNQNLSASKDGTGDILSFDLVVISGEETKTVTATEQKDVLQKAKGKAILYNNFSASPQLLSIDTRLEGSNGKMYKTEKKTTVPGMKDGKPGSIEVGIYADEAGEGSNSAPLDFKIFGFKGGPKYTQFY